jgi:hypothetical protein
LSPWRCSSRIASDECRRQNGRRTRMAALCVYGTRVHVSFLFAGTVGGSNRSQHFFLATMPRFAFLSITTVVVPALLLSWQSPVSVAAANSTSTASASHLAGCWSGETRSECHRRQCRRERQKGTLAPNEKCWPPNLHCVYNIQTCYEYISATQGCRNWTVVSACDCDATTQTWSCRQGDCPRRQKDPRC